MKPQERPVRLLDRLQRAERCDDHRRYTDHRRATQETTMRRMRQRGQATRAAIAASAAGVL